MAMKHEYKVLPLDQIKPYENNPRNNKAAIKQVVESIRRNGYGSPIVVDRDYVIIAGHSRYEALKQLKYKEAGVMVMDIPKEVADRLRIEDNRTSEYSRWDWEKLDEELRKFDIEFRELNFPDFKPIELEDGEELELRELGDDDEFTEVNCPNCNYKFHVEQ